MRHDLTVQRYQRFAQRLELAGRLPCDGGRGWQAGRSLTRITNSFRKPKCRILIAGGIPITCPVSVPRTTLARPAGCGERHPVRRPATRPPPISTLFTSFLQVPTFSELNHHNRTSVYTMSALSKAFFGFSMLATGGTIWAVHYMQQQESDVSKPPGFARGETDQL